MTNATTKRAMLRTCDGNLRAYNDFQWPASGPVAAPDWTPEPVCGGGLHGLLDGCGDSSLLSWDPDAKWLVVEVDEWVAIDDAKVKAPRGEVVFCGDRSAAVALGVERYGWDVARCVAGTATAGARGTATAGARGTATAGYAGTATAGDDGTATAGVRGTATAGARGTATAGVRGTATAGARGTATAGVGGVIQLRWWDGKRYRIATCYVGEDGIEPNVPYRVDERGRAVRAESLAKEPAP